MSNPQNFTDGLLDRMRDVAALDDLCMRCKQRPREDAGPFGDRGVLCGPCADRDMQIELDAYWHFDDVEQGED